MATGCRNRKGQFARCNTGRNNTSRRRWLFRGYVEVDGDPGKVAEQLRGWWDEGEVSTIYVNSAMPDGAGVRVAGRVEPHPRATRPAVGDDLSNTIRERVGRIPRIQVGDFHWEFIR